MQRTTMNDLLVSLDAAWLCAAERDVEREDEERARAAARVKMQSLKGKYELDASAQLDADLKRQQLELRRRAARRRQRQLPGATQLPVLVHGLPPHSPQEEQRDKTTKRMDKPNIYELENQRLAALVNQKNPVKPTRIKTVVKKKPKPRIVEDMLALERRYATSARRLQRWWRSLSRRRFWKSYFIKVRAATQIQRLVRGFVCRGLVRTWHRNRTLRATLIQAAVRGFLMRKVIATWKLWEYTNAVRIQAIVRGHNARRTARKHRQSLAATRIQCLWRGRRSRRRTDLLWLAVRAIELQRLVRGVQARKRVRRRRMIYNDAATQIQRIFRGTQARSLVEKILRDRETANRIECMQMLEAEEEWYRNQRNRLQSRLERFKLLEQLCDLEEQYFRAHERISDMESIYQDMQIQRLRVSPRAIEHGWVEEMEHKMKLQRQTITTRKMEVIFDLGLKFKRKEQEYLEFVERIRVLEEKRQRLEIARSEEFLDYWERECKYQYEVKEIERRRRVGDTKRKWCVQFYRLNGKRDKRWQGTHWTPDVVQDAKRREVFCLSNTNLLAKIEAKWRSHLRMSSPARDVNEEDATRERLGELEDQVAMVTADAQIQQTAAIFDPVIRDVEARFDEVKAKQLRNERLSQSRKAKIKAAVALTQQNTVEKEHKELPVTKSDSPERQLKLRRAMQASRIPWHLLDQLAAERRKLEEEKAMFRIWRKVHPSMFVTNKNASDGG